MPGSLPETKMTQASFIYIYVSREKHSLIHQFTKKDIRSSTFISEHNCTKHLIKMRGGLQREEIEEASDLEFYLSEARGEMASAGKESDTECSSSNCERQAAAKGEMP